MLVALLSGKVIYLREEKASQFVPTSSVGIFVAQGDEGLKERIMLSHEVDLWICKISSSTPFIYIPSFFNTITSLSRKKNLNFLLNVCFANSGSRRPRCLSGCSFRKWPAVKAAGEHVGKGIEKLSISTGTQGHF